MASLARIKARGAGGRPTWRIQFYDGAGQRRAVYLGAVPKKAAETWVSRVEQLNACLVAGVAPDTDLAGWVASLPDSTHDKLVRAGLAEPRAAARKVVTLGQLTEAFVARPTTPGPSQIPPAPGMFHWRRSATSSTPARRRTGGCWWPSLGWLACGARRRSGR